MVELVELVELVEINSTLAFKMVEIVKLDCYTKINYLKCLKHANSVNIALILMKLLPFDSSR